jgi:superfamily II DNA or RNA helicase
MSLFEINQQKTEYQHSLITQWRDSGCIGTLECYVGFGKTYMAILAIKRMHAKNMFFDKIVIVVPTLYLKDQWEKELRDHNLISLCEVIVINGLTANWLNNKIKVKSSLLILDEIHRYTAQQFGTVFDCVEYKFLLGLTATLNDGDKENLIRLKAPVVGRISLKEGIAKGWTAEFRIYNYGVDLDEQQMEEYKTIEKNYNKYIAIFNFDYSIALKCLTSVEFRRQYAKELNYRPEWLFNMAQQFNNFKNKRSNFILNNEDKLFVADDIIKMYANDKILVFSERIATIEMFATNLEEPCIIYHSKLKAKERREIFNKINTDFVNGNIRIIASAKSFDEGVNLPDIETLISFSGNSTKRQGIQRYGRGIRYKENKHVKIFELYLKGTQDEKWLKKRQKDVPRHLIKDITNLDQVLI